MDAGCDDEELLVLLQQGEVASALKVVRRLANPGVVQAEWDWMCYKATVKPVKILR